MMNFIQRIHYSYACAYFFSLPFYFLIVTRCTAHCHFNRVQVQALPTEQAAPVLTDSLSQGYDPYTHACKARPLTTVGRTSLSVIIIIVLLFSAWVFLFWLKAQASTSSLLSQLGSRFPWSVANSRASVGDRSAHMRTRKKNGVRSDGQSCGLSSLKRKRGKPNGWACHVFGETSASDTMRLSLPLLTQRLLLRTKTWLQHLPSRMQHQLLLASMRLTTPSPTQRLLL